MVSKHYLSINREERKSFKSSKLWELKVTASEEIWEFWESFYLSALLRIHLGVLGYWVLRVFFHFCEVSFISKNIFQSLLVNVGFTPNQVNYCVIYIFITFVYHHIYIFSEVAVIVIFIYLLNLRFYNKRIVWNITV